MHKNRTSKVQQSHVSTYCGRLNGIYLYNKPYQLIVVTNFIRRKNSNINKSVQAIQRFLQVES